MVRMREREDLLGGVAIALVGRLEESSKREHNLYLLVSNIFIDKHNKEVIIVAQLSSLTAKYWHEALTTIRELSQVVVFGVSPGVRPVRVQV